MRVGLTAAGISSGAPTEGDLLSAQVGSSVAESADISATTPTQKATELNRTTAGFNSDALIDVELLSPEILGTTVWFDVNFLQEYGKF